MSSISLPGVSATTLALYIKLEPGSPSPPNSPVQITSTDDTVIFRLPAYRYISLQKHVANASNNNSPPFMEEP